MLITDNYTCKANKLWLLMLIKEDCSLLMITRNVASEILISFVAIKVEEVKRGCNLKPDHWPSSFITLMVRRYLLVEPLLCLPHLRNSSAL